MPKISVIIPVYNVEKFLRRCLDSIINQTMNDIEIILIDDGSTDNSGNICDEYAEKDDRIIVIHKENGGVSSARNKGLDIASGEYVTFVDSDDYIDNNMYEVLYRNVIEKSVDISACCYEYIDKNNKSLYNKDKIECIGGLYTGKSFLELQYKNSNSNIVCICVWNKIYRKDIFRELRFEHTIHEDEIICDQIFTQGYKIYLTDSPLYKYVENKDSIVNREFSKEKLVSLDILYNRVILYKEKNIDLYYKALLSYCEMNIYYNLKSKSIGYNYKKYKRQFNKLFLYAIKVNEISIKNKIRYLLYYLSPCIYNTLIESRVKV